jgi:hypothetical protein
VWSFSRFASARGPGAVVVAGADGAGPGLRTRTTSEVPEGTDATVARSFDALLRTTEATATSSPAPVSTATVAPGRKSDPLIVSRIAPPLRLALTDEIDGPTSVTASTSAERSVPGLRTAARTTPGVLRTSGTSSRWTTSSDAETNVVGASTPSSTATAPSRNFSASSAESQKRCSSIPDCPA